jgi:hypothetical protein
MQRTHSLDMTGHGHPGKAPIGLGLWVELCPYTPEAKGMRWARRARGWADLHSGHRLYHAPRAAQVRPG